MSPGAEVTCLDATDLASEVPGRAQQGILGDVDMTGTSAPDQNIWRRARRRVNLCTHLRDGMGAEDTAARRTADCGVRLRHAPPPSERVAGFAG